MLIDHSVSLKCVGAIPEIAIKRLIGTKKDVPISRLIVGIEKGSIHCYGVYIDDAVHGYIICTVLDRELIVLHGISLHRFFIKKVNAVINQLARAYRCDSIRVNLSPREYALGRSLENFGFTETEKIYLRRVKYE